MASAGDLWNEIVSRVHRYLLEPTNLTADQVAPVAGQIPEFLLILLLFYVVSKVLVWGLSKTFLSPRRVDPMIGNLVGRLLMGILLFVGFALALMVFGVNIFSLALTLGLIGAALALGLQNTVANIMGGISLASDRPFEVGDRIRIGDQNTGSLWGDVERIGLRSTRILTTRREYVVVPNRLMDEREIWNYTKQYPELRIDVGVTISYDSDRELARSLMLRAAEEDPEVLAFPKPRVLVMDFGDSGLRLELQCYIGDARNRSPASSALREAIKDAFDANRVEVPFPYRTIVYKSELPPPRHMEPGEVPTLRPLGDRRVLAATAGATPALNKAQTICDIAKRLNADLVIVFITPKASVVTQREGERAADIFATAAERAGIGVKLVVEEGGLVDSIVRVARREMVGAVIMGASRSPVLMAWKNAGVEERLKHALDMPVVIVPPSLEVLPSAIDAARAHLDTIAPPMPREEGDAP